jgi:cobalt-zinc-cadmium efflux system membrane fusion protein
MKHMLLLTVGAAALAISGTGCSYLRPKQENADAKVSQEQTDNTKTKPRTVAGAGPSDQRPAQYDYGRGRRRGRFNAIAMPLNENDAFEVATEKVSYRQVRSVHTAMGKILAPQTRLARVSYAFPARVSAIAVQLGDWVEKGQLVMTLQSEEVGRTKAEYYKCIADLELARANYEREKRLSDRGVGAAKNVVTSEAELKVAQSNLDAAEKKLHVLGFSEDEVRAVAKTHQVNPEVTLLSPISGKVIEQKAILGGMIDQSSDLMTIMDPRVLWIEAEIFERDIGKILIGQQAEVTVPAFPGRIFRTRLKYISDLLKEDSRTVSVRAELDNSDFRLKPGMFADMTILTGKEQPVLTIPAQALLDEENQQIVFAKIDKQYIARAVTIGARQNGYCEVIDGLQEGELVVTRGNYQLKSKMHAAELKKSGVH